MIGPNVSNTTRPADELVDGKESGVAAGSRSPLRKASTATQENAEWRTLKLDLSRVQVKVLVFPLGHLITKLFVYPQLSISKLFKILLIGSSSDPLDPLVNNSSNQALPTGFSTAHLLTLVNFTLYTIRFVGYS